MSRIARSKGVGVNSCGLKKSATRCHALAPTKAESDILDLEEYVFPPDAQSDSERLTSP
jgi:hypothetical protein